MKLTIDLETTGLDPHRNPILEVGAIALDKDLHEFNRFHAIARYPTSLIRDELVDPKVQKMHTENSLWKACSVSIFSVSEIDWQFAEWLDKIRVDQGEPDRLIELLGRSIHFDQAMMIVQMPESSKRFHYRIHDVGAMRRELELCGVTLTTPNQSIHRAIPDCEFETEEAREIRRAMRKMVAQLEAV